MKCKITIASEKITDVLDAVNAIAKVSTDVTEIITEIDKNRELPYYMEVEAIVDDNSVLHEALKYETAATYVGPLTA